MKKLIFCIVLMCGAYVSAQTHTFCATDTNCTTTGNNTHSGTETFNGTVIMGASLNLGPFLLSCSNNVSCITARNAANNADISLAQLDASNVEVLGAPVRIVEVAAPSGVAASDVLYPDSTAHRWKMNNNNGGADVVVGAATTDPLTNKTLTGATSGNSVTIPGSCAFQNNLAPVVGNSADQTFFTCTLTGGTVASGKGLRVTFTWKHSTGAANITYKMLVGGVLIINFGSIADAISSTYSLSVILYNEGTTLAKAGQYFYDDSGIGRGTGGYSNAIAVNLASNQTIAMQFNVANTNQVTPFLMFSEVLQ